MTFFAVASLIGVITLSLAKHARIRFESALCLVNFSIIGTLYIAAMCGLLAQGVILILLMAAPAVYTLATGLRTERDVTLPLLKSPAFLAYSAFIVFSSVWNAGRAFNHWDEFTHWGLVVKNMALYDAFGNIPEASTFFPRYPPASSLFIYFFEKTNREFSEPLAYMGYGLLLFSVLLGIFSGAFRGSSRNWVSISLIALIVPTVFYGAEFYSKLYVDALLALLFALILVQYYSNETIDRALSIRLSLSLFTLALVKDSGALLGSMALLIIAADFLVFSFRRNKVGLLWLLLPALMLAIARISWIHYLNSASSVPASITSHLSFAGIRGLLASPPEHWKPTIVNFVTSFYREFAVPILAIGGLLFGLTRISGQQAFARRVPLLALGLGLSFIVYTSSLLALYLFAFVPREAIMIASFHRYLSTFALGAVLSVIGIYTARLDLTSPPWPKFIRYTSLSLTAIYLPLFAWRYMDKRLDAGIRKEYAHFIEIGKELNAKTHKIYYASRNHVFTSRDFFISHYLATPVKVESDSYLSLFNTPNPKDESRMSPEQWASSHLSNYTHFYLHSYPESFPSEFGWLFTTPASIAPHTLYRIEHSSGRLSLVKQSSY